MASAFASVRSGGSGCRRAEGSLLTLDPELGRGLAPDQIDRARAALRVTVLTVRRGPWLTNQDAPTASGHVGLLILDGVAAREVVVEDLVSSELLGAGDLIVPWASCPEHGSAGETLRWQALASLRVALLDRRTAQAIAAFPGVNQVLLERVIVQGQRLATIKALSQLNSVERRLLGLFRHCASRWGRVTSRGIVIPLTLSHRLLGELVGARRPTVTTALSALTRAGTITRGPDSTWLLTEAALDVPERTPPTPTQHRRALLVNDPRASREAVLTPSRPTAPTRALR